MGTVRIITVEYVLGDEDGAQPPDEAYRDVLVVPHDGLSTDDAVELIRRVGLKFSATGNSWAADPDGSCMDPRGLHHEVTAHLDGWSEADEAEIIGRVG
jgi:hypothetical protein